ncbi:MAG: hypothetical protein JNK00_05520 [Flavipsychrobacter sp.]|nr:hypothetical protein [Flavipsychrobacter sp.]
MRIFLILCFFSFAVLGQACDSQIVTMQRVWKYDHLMDADNSPVTKDSGIIIKETKPVVIPIANNEMYSHYEIKIRRDAEKILLICEIMQSKDFIACKLFPTKNYYIIEFANGVKYTYHEPYENFYSTFNNIEMVVLLDGMMYCKKETGKNNGKMKRTKAYGDKKLMQLFLSSEVVYIQSYSASYSFNGHHDNMYLPGDKIVFNHQQAAELKRALKCIVLTK